MLGRIIRKNRPGTLPETNQDALRIGRISKGNITRIPTSPFSARFSQVAKRLAFLLELVSMAQHGRWARCRGPKIAPAIPLKNPQFQELIDFSMFFFPLFRVVVSFDLGLILFVIWKPHRKTNDWKWDPSYKDLVQFLSSCSFSVWFS